MTLDDLPARFSTILCDVWGVIHDGASLYPGVARRFALWHDEGRQVIILTNAPRPADRVAAGLAALGLDEHHWAHIASSGQAGINALTNPPHPVGFCGDRYDRADLIAHGVMIAAEGEDYDDVVLTGLDEYRHEVSDYQAELAAWKAKGVTLHCLNPDRIVVHRGQRLVCAGAIADAYEDMQGQVIWYGKPEAPIFDHALSLAGNPPLDTVIMIGDGPHTDMLGACRKGMDAVFASGGIQEGEGYEWGEEFGSWRPIMTVRGL